MGVDLKPAVFLDRDGVINPEIFYSDTQSFESPRSPEEFSLFPGVPGALFRLQQAGYLLFIVSNQPNYAKGKNSLEELALIHAKMIRLLQAGEIVLTDNFYCYHHPLGIVPAYSGICECRKPLPYFLLRAAQKHTLDLGASWMIGDRETDIECGKKAGVNTLKIVSQTLAHDMQNGIVATSLQEAAEMILRKDV